MSVSGPTQMGQSLLRQGLSTPLKHRTASNAQQKKLRNPDDAVFTSERQAMSYTASRWPGNGRRFPTLRG